MSKIKIPGRLENAEYGGYVTGTEDIYDDTSSMTQKQINDAQAQTNTTLAALITSLPVSDGTNISSGAAYIDSTDRCVKVKA